MRKIRRPSIIRVFVVALVVLGAATLLPGAAIGAGGVGNAPNSRMLCLYSADTNATVYLNIGASGLVVGDFCIDGCECGSILGEAHLAGDEGARYGTINFYADLPEVCAFGLWYSVDMPSLSYLWNATELDSASESSYGSFERISCSIL